MRVLISIFIVIIIFAPSFLFCMVAVTRLQEARPSDLPLLAGEMLAEYRDAGLTTVVSNPGLYDKAILQHPGYVQMRAYFLSRLHDRLQHHRDAFFQQGQDPVFSESFPVDLLEFGPGTGTITDALRVNFRFAHAIRSLTLVEPDLEALAFTQSRVASPLTDKDQTVLRYVDDISKLSGERYDFIYGSFALHHVPDQREFMGTLRELIAEDGEVVIGEEFITPYQSYDERCVNLLTYHSSVMDALGGSWRRKAKRDMRFIEFLALLNGLVGFDEAKTSLEDFQRLATETGFEIRESKKWFPDDTSVAGVYSLSLVLR